MTLLPMDRRVREQRALFRAWAWDLASDVRPARERNVYHVPSRSEPGLLHRVVANPGGRYWCSCPAGSTGAPCTHAAALYLYLLGRRGVRVVDVQPA